MHISKVGITENMSPIRIIPEINFMAFGAMFEHLDICLF